MEYRDIEKIYKDYCGTYEINNRRGRDSIAFTQDNEQWEPQAQSQRLLANKETLTCNATIKYVNRIKSQNRQIQFQADVYQTSSDADSKKYQSFDLLLKHFYTKKDLKEMFDSAFDKCIDYGYSVAEVNYGYDDKRTLNLDPVVTIYDDPSEAFFDLKAQLKSRIDGNYCGRCRKLTKQELMDAYPDLVIDGYIKEKHNKVIDYWCRQKGKAWYVQLKTGVWYRQDLLSQDAYNNDVQRKIDGTLIRKRGTRDDIYFYRYINEKCIIDKRPYPTEDLPLVYHSGLTYWTHNGIRTAPYAWYLQSPQRLINLINSQIATNLKNSTSRQFFLSNEHITNDKQKDELREINNLEGAFVVGDDPQKMLIVQPTEVPQTMIALAQQSAGSMDIVAGSMNDAQNSDNAVISGVAIKEITNNIQMVNAGLVSEHMRFIDAICHLLTQMIPNIVTEERDFYVKDNNGQMEKIGVNIKTETDVIINDIASIRNDFLYEINAGATTVMERENTIKALMMSYQINPQMFNATADIFYKNLDTSYSYELSRRALAFVDPDIVKLGSGEINQEEFQQIQQQKQAQAQQQGGGPEMAQNIAAQAEVQKAAADTQNAQTNAMKAQAQIQQQQTKNHLEATKVANQIGAQNVQHQLDAAQLQMEATQKMIDEQRMGDEDAGTNQ